MANLIIPLCCVHAIRGLADAERGRLMLAAVDYCYERREPDFRGGEKYIWPEIKAAIDEAERAELSAKKAEAGRVGGLAKASKGWQTLAAPPSSPLKPPINPLKERVSKDTPKKSPQQIAQEFTQFWTAYPKKKNKTDAEKAFRQIADVVPIDCLLDAIEAQKKSADWQKEGGQFIPYPATWLRRGAWMDELSSPACSIPEEEPIRSRWIETGEFDGYREYWINGKWVRRE